jgi:hypothetical protein
MTVAASRIGWRTPAVMVGCGCLIALLSFGPRSALGQFLNPLSLAGNWSRDVFSLALALQNLLWGIGQPFAVRSPTGSALPACCQSARCSMRRVSF